MLTCTDVCPLFICISCLCNTMHNDLLQVTCNKEFEFEFEFVLDGLKSIALSNHTSIYMYMFTFIWDVTPVFPIMRIHQEYYTLCLYYYNYFFHYFRELKVIEDDEVTVSIKYMFLIKFEVQQILSQSLSWMNIFFSQQIMPYFFLSINWSIYTSSIENEARDEKERRRKR